MERASRSPFCVLPGRECMSALGQKQTSGLADVAARLVRTLLAGIV